MQDAKTGGSRWVPDIREDEITEFQEQNGDETATYKAVNVHPIISRVLDKLAFFRTHVSAVWYNKLANKTVKDKLDEIDTSISSLNSNISNLNSRIQLDTIEMSVPKGSFIANSAYRVGNLVIFSVAFNIATTVNSNEVLVQFEGISAKSRFDFAIRDSNTTIGDGALLTGTNGIIANAISLNPGGYFCAGAFVMN